MIVKKYLILELDFDVIFFFGNENICLQHRHGCIFFHETGSIRKRYRKNKRTMERSGSLVKCK